MVTGTKIATRELGKDSVYREGKLYCKLWDKEISVLSGDEEPLAYLDEEVDRGLLRRALSRLEKRDREIIVMRFGLDGKRERTQKEVADMLNISQSYISRLEKRIIAALRKDMQKMM